MLTRLIISNAALFVAIALLAALHTVPTARSVRRHSQAIAEARASLEYRYANRHLLRKILEDVDELTAALPALRAIAVPEGTELNLVREIERLAGTHGVTQKLRPLPQPESGPTDYRRQLGLEITATGDFRALAAFLEDVERLPHAFLKPRIAFTTAKDGAVTTLQYSASVSWPKQ